MSSPSIHSTHHKHHHSRTLVDHRSLFFWSRSSVDGRSLSESHHHHGRHESVDKERSGSPCVSRREVQLSLVASQPTEKRTITVIALPPRPAEVDDPAGVTGLTDSAVLADSAQVTGPTDSTEVHDSAGDESARDCGRLGMCCRPATGTGPGRCRLSITTGLSSGRLGKGWRACWPGYPSRDYASCSTRYFHGFWCQQLAFSVPSENDWTS